MHNQSVRAFNSLSATVILSFTPVLNFLFAYICLNYLFFKRSLHASKKDCDHIMKLAVVQYACINLICRTINEKKITFNWNHCCLQLWSDGFPRVPLHLLWVRNIGLTLKSQISFRVRGPLSTCWSNTRLSSFCPRPPPHFFHAI